MRIPPKQIAMAVVALAVVYPIGYGLLRSDTSTDGLAILLAALPFAVAGAIWLMLQVSKPRLPAAEPFVARHPRLAGVIGAAAVLAMIAAGGVAIRLLRAP